MCFGKAGPALSHLFFADDNVIFCRANKENEVEINKCLEKYCKWTGQYINVEKSGCFFSKNTKGSTKAMVKHILNLKELRKDAKYLGNPLFVGGNKARAFEDLRCRVESNHELERKAALQSWPGHPCQVGDLHHPLLCDGFVQAFCYMVSKIDMMALRFFWIGNENKDWFLTPIAWDRICAPKACGWLGFRKMEDINKAMICKLGWSLACEKDRIWVKALKSKYFLYSTCMYCKRK